MRWPWTRLTPEQEEDRDWRRYERRIGLTLHLQGYRGDPVSLAEARAWAKRYCEEARARGQASQ